MSRNEKSNIRPDSQSETLRSQGKFAFSRDEQLDETVREQILKLFEKEQIFKVQNLTVGNLSKKLGISVRELPKYFKYFFETDFKSFLNDYRVCLAKEMIEEGYLDVYTLEALGGWCGFSSRTTFFNAFKKKYYKSPRDFWRAFQENEV
ncbi:helix-turn-helix domain-containing protein [Algoriphagus yeomjeoni]|uniref:AraC-like DNA-binding protein n=1 Tax=Algoriphagus yeomjeoni TaxID=291403 RepID=A0A327PLY0_9BACT|nr:helix-turn-helix domain-containing protein [Algoriphagus yeomjeoni]RAI92294.1 AraC-like DNA-binding protein [Algoriphagus yeomjeoni]